GLLSVPDKEELKRAECVLSPTSYELAFIEQLYIYLNLTKPTDRLYLSFASVGSKGDSLIPSYLIDVLKNMYEGLVIRNACDYRPRIFIEDIKQEMGRLLGSYVSGLLDEKMEEKLFDDIAILRSIEGGEEWCRRIIDNSFKEYVATPLEKETAGSLYEELLKVSVSTLEQFAGCSYAYFVMSGLELKEREVYGLESVDMGNLAHDVLERVGEKLKNDSLDFSTADIDFMDAEIDRAIEHLGEEYNGDLLRSDEKTKYYAKQLSRIMKRTVRTLGFQLSKGKFKPEMYEMRFKKIYDLDETSKVMLKGRIDRADIYEDESGNKYVKIIDYKSSKRNLDLLMMSEGLSLQLAVYMKEAIENIRKKYPDKNVLPAAMLYYAIDDPFVTSSGDVESEIRKQLRPNGAIVNDDKVLGSLDESLLDAGTKSEVVRVTKKKDNTPDSYSQVYSTEEFNRLLDSAEEKSLELSKEILSGNIEIAPFKKGNKTACDYCSLKGYCGFDKKIKGYAYRVIGEESEDDIQEDSE
ncbi:MAG: PD-(D/E)XK nuclease family protein, partial [Lachnospiraceae bacterium]|nr:PD-(D/E)XK nuclease family protein [Lachnospiraceae bacterium]